LTLGWFAEPFQAYGSFTGEGARRVLGKPGLHPLTVLVRETVQNSWDAKRSDRDGVDFAMDGWSFSDEQLHTLRQEVFTGLPPEGITLGEILDREEVSALVISDRGTLGLGGPLRADRPAGGRSDFIDLVFNMGQPRDVPGGGGTYGFGKTIAYIVSEASTAILYSRTRVEAEIESRLIAVAVGSQYATQDQRFTGRHWWGVTGAERVEPLTGPEADDLALRLGFPGFEGEETGLSMMVIAPRFNERTPRQTMTFMANALTWNFWPKMIPRDPNEGEAPMTFRVSWQGEDIAVPDPEQHPPLTAYVKAFRALHAYEDDREHDITAGIFPIRSQRPNRQLGLLALTRVPREPRRYVDEGADAEDDLVGSAAFSGNSHHVALLRRVELIVKYLEGPELPGAHVEWAGVFINDDDIDNAFAEAEPPTHDDWEPSMVEDKHDRRLVNLALRNIKIELRRELAPLSATPGNGETRSAVVIGNALGSLIAGAPGTGATKTTSGGVPGGTGGSGDGREGDGGQGGTAGGGGVGSGSPKPTILGLTARPALHGGSPATEVEFSVDTRGSDAQVHGSAHAAIDGFRAEREPPLGAAVPQVVGWRRSTEATISVNGDRLTVEAHDEGTWIMIVSNPAGTAVSVDIRATTSVS
jgi:hypothetical protein